MDALLGKGFVQIVANRAVSVGRGGVVGLDLQPVTGLLAYHDADGHAFAGYDKGGQRGFVFGLISGAVLLDICLVIVQKMLQQDDRSIIYNEWEKNNLARILLKTFMIYDKI